MITWLQCDLALYLSESSACDKLTFLLVHSLCLIWMQIVTFQFCIHESDIIFLEENNELRNIDNYGVE